MGGSSGGEGHTPYEAPDSGRSKQRVKIVEILSEGEIKGLVDGVKSVYLNKTTLQNQDGSYNFNNVSAQGRIGSQNQSVMTDFNTSEKEVSVGVEVRANTPITRTITDEKVNRLRVTLGVKSLFNQNDQGDTNGASVSFRISYGSFSQVITISGKYSTQYLRQVELNELPAVPFQIQVERLNDDSQSQRLQNGTIWASYTEIIDTEFAYPNTALVGVKFDSDYFSNLPQRNYEIYGIKCQVPQNYDPITRRYEGFWDGTFKVEWTDNPAWIFYDLMTNKRYGMGQRLGEFGVDKWQLYAIAKYCDVMVDDGFGGQEPRMTCNCWLTEQKQAYQIIQDLASVFRAMPVWNGTQLTAIQDRPQDPVWTYTNANVVDGEFSRSYSALKARHNAIHVEYLDKTDFYQRKIEYVSDDDLIKRFGLNVKKVTAFGCTSRGQANRLGRWILETEKLEKETITFKVGREGLMHLPGDIIRVSDNHYAGTNVGGRVLAIDGQTVTLDRPIELNGESYFTFINAQANSQTLKITSLGENNQILLEQEPVGLSTYGIWSLSTAVIHSGLYKAINIVEEDGMYSITALQHEPQKEKIVDRSAYFEDGQTTLYRALPATPTASAIHLDETGVTLTWSQPTVLGLVTYEVTLYKDGEVYRTYRDLKELSLKFDGLPTGSYIAKIRAKNQLGQYSEPVSKAFEINLSIKDFRATPELFAIRFNWTLPITAKAGHATEIWQSVDDNVGNAKRITTLAYPQDSYTLTNVGLSERYYFFARLVDNKTGNKGEFCLGILGEANHNADQLVQALQGKITRSELGDSLIESLQQDINTAVESAVENNQQNQQVLNQLSTRLNQNESTLSQLQRSITNNQQTTNQQITQLESRLSQNQGIDNLSAKVQQLSNTVADVTGKVSSSYTIKTQTIAGNRKAISGIALGASSDNKTAESSVIVMADKFGVVKSATDGQVTPLLSVVTHNGQPQLAMNGNIITTGTILGANFKGGNIDIGGKFKVDSSGTTTIRSNRNNVGLVLNSDGLSIYDEKGQLVVKCGKLR